jgi:hypothetical protein
MRKALITAASFAVLLAGVVSAPAASAVVTCPTVSGGTGAVSAPVPAPGVDWAGCDLTGASIFYLNMAGANLTGANLTGAQLAGANLTGANLTGANLTGAVMAFTNLAFADLTGANLTSAAMSGVNLTGAYVSCSDTGILGTGITSFSPNLLPTGWTLVSGTLSVPIVICVSAPATTATPILMWMQSMARDTATATCPAGYAGSWAAWPNGGKGGYVCDKFVPIYGN